MPKNIDERIVQMQFDNKAFEQSAQKTLGTLSKLKESLKFDGSVKGLNEINGAAKKINLQHIYDQLTKLNREFATATIAWQAAITNLTGKLMDLGWQLTDNLLGLSQIQAGFAEYETQINATQTILANTKQAGKTIDDVNASLDELNEYADKTIYNFTEMTKNIGLFTSAGVGLEDATAAIKGLSNVAAMAGSNSESASRAMYQMSQALSSGYVKLQDWVSIENAGMASAAFQDAIKETARVHGVAVDEIIADYGSFRNSLTEPKWLTSDILLETLNIMTGDITEAQMKQMGYSDQQIKKLKEVAATAVESATVIRTWSQLLQNSAEVIGSGWATTWRLVLGDYEEAKVLFTTLSEYMVTGKQKAAEARNEMIKQWADLGGRAHIIQGVYNIFEALFKILGSISTAWKNVFPPATADGLVALSAAFEKFTEGLIISDQAAKNLTDIFSGLFSITKMGTDVFKLIAKSIFTVGNALSPLSNAAMGVSAVFGRMLSSLAGVSRNVSTTATNISQSSAEMEDSLYYVEVIVVGIKNAFLEMANSLRNGIKALGGEIDGFLSESGLQKLADFITTVLMIGILFNIKKFIGGLADIGSGLGEAMGNVAGVLDEAKGVLGSFQSTIKAQTIKTIAESIVMLSASLLGLSLIDPEDMVKSLGGITVLFTELIVAMVAINKASGMFELEGIIKLPAVLLGLAASITILAGAVGILAAIPLENLALGLASVGVLLTELVLALNAMSASSATWNASALSLLALGSAIKSMAKSVVMLSNINFVDLIKGLPALEVILLQLGAMGKVFGQATGVTQTAAALLIISGAVNAFGLVIRTLGSLDLPTLGKGLVTIGASLALMALAVNQAGFNEEAAGALMTVAQAILILVPAFVMLGNMDIASIVKALAAMAGVFVVFAGAAKLLTPVIPAIVALGGSILGMGVGLLAASTALVLITGALTAFAVAFVAASAGIGVSLTMLLNMLPSMVEAFVNTFIATLQAVTDGAAAIVDAFVGMVVAMVKAVSDNAIQLIAVGVELIANIMIGVTEQLPYLMRVATDLVVTFARELGANMSPLVDAGIKLIVDLLNALADALDNNTVILTEALFRVGKSLIKAGLNIIATAAGLLIPGLLELALSLIKSFADALGIDKFIEIGKNIVNGVIEGIKAGLGLIADAARWIADTLVGAVENDLEIHSPSVVMFTLAQFAIEGFVNGLQNGIPKLEKTSHELGRAMLTPVKDTAEAYAQVDKILSDGLDSYDHFWQEYAEELEELKLGNRELKKHSNSLKDFKTQVANAQEEANKLAEANSNFFDITQVASDAILAFGERYGEVLGTLDADATLQAAKAGFMEMTTQAAESSGKFDELKDKFAQVAEKEAEIAEKAKEANMTVEEFKTTMSESELAALNMSDSLGFLRDSYNDLKSGIADTVESQMSIFEEFQRKTDLSSEQLLTNMRTQINAISDWSRNLQDLAARGIDEGLLKKLAEMGPQGYEYVNAFTNMTTSQLEQANELYGKAMKLPDKISNEIMASYAYAGLMATNGFAQGLMKEPGVEKAVEMAKASSTALNTALEIHSPSEVTKASGQYFTQGFAQGIANNVTMVTNAVSGLIRNAVSSLQGHEEEFKMAGDSLVQSFATAIETSASIGTSFVESFTSAFSSNSAAVTGSMLTLATNMLDSLSKGLTSNTGLVEKAAKSINYAVTRGFGDSSAEMINKGRNVSESYADGITKAATSAINAVRSLGNKVHAEINTFKTSYESSGEGLIEAIVKGFKSMENRLVNAAGNLTSESLSEVESYYSWFMDAGESLVRGFASGITAYTFYAEARAAAMARRAYEAAMEELDAHSPSRLMEKVGGYFAKGFSNGIESDTTLGEDSAARMAQTAMDATMTVLDRIAALLDGRLDLMPTITPVLDLSQIEKDAKRLDTMMNNQMANKTSQMFNASSQNGSNSLENGVNGNNTGGGDIIFNQYNTSPKALSRIDIYRQTKTQLSQAKGLI